MKSIYNISHNIYKILIMLLLIVFLSACGNDTPKDEATICDSTTNGKSAYCIDVKDSTCLGCEIFELLFDAVSVNVMKLHGQLTSGAMAFMMICFSIWLAFRLLKFVSSATESSVSQIWNDIAKQGFLCLFCGILASSPDMLIYAVNTFVYPIYASLLKLGIAILETATTNSNGGGETINVYGSTITIASGSLSCSFDKSGLITNSGFPKELSDTISCMIRTLKNYLTIGGEISVKLMQGDFEILRWISGLVLWVTFMIVKIGFVFYLVDVIFQMGIIILMLPIFILGYAFKSTRKWTNVAIQNILVSAGFLMCFSMIVMVVLRGMVELIKNNQDIFSPPTPEVDAANLGLGVTCLLLIGFFVYGSVGVTEQITSSLIGSEVDAKFQQNMIKALDKVKGWGLKALGGILSAGSVLLPGKVKDLIYKAKEIKAKVNKIAGRD